MGVEAREVSIDDVVGYQGQLAVALVHVPEDFLAGVAAGIAKAENKATVEELREAEIEGLVALVQILGVPLKPNTGEANDAFEARVKAQRAEHLDAFTTIMELTSDDVRRVVRGFVGVKEHAVHDVVQEVYLRAFKNIDTFQAKAKFTTWLYRIAVNESNTYLGRENREKDRRQRFEGKLFGTAIYGDSSHLKDIRDPGSATRFLGVEREADMGEAVRQALSNLTPARRKVVVLRAITGLSHKEVGEILGIGAETSKARYSEGLSQLRRTLGPAYADWEVE